MKISFPELTDVFRRAFGSRSKEVAVLNWYKAQARRCCGANA
jgi:hypothetical protein